MTDIQTSTWHRMRELVLLSLNIIYLKDILQQTERLGTRLDYMNIAKGSTSVIRQELLARKHRLHIRMKRQLENLINSTNQYETDFAFNIDVESACLTRKQLQKGYALLTNIRDNTYALNIRNGALTPVAYPEINVLNDGLGMLEYTAQHDGPVYKYFDIDETDPLLNNLRY